MLKLPRLRRRALLGALGIIAILVSGFCAWDALRMRPSDGTVWLTATREIRLVGLTPGGPADRAGLRAGDVIEAIDREAIRSPAHATEMLQGRKSGDRVSYLFRRGRAVREAQLRLSENRLSEIRSYLVYATLGFIYLLAGAYVFLNNPSLPQARLFYVLCCIFLVYFCAASERSVFYYWANDMVRNLGTLAALLVPPLFLHFFLAFPSPRAILRRNWLVALLYLPPLAYYLNFSLGQFMRGETPTIGALQQVTLGFYFTAGLASLLANFVTSKDPIQRQRVKFLTLGTLVGVLPFLVFNIALGKLLGRSDLALLGAVPMVLVPISFGYSIARYRLMDLDVILRRSLVYAVLTFVVVATYLVLVIVVGRFVLALSGQSSQLVAILATLLIAAAFAPARERIQSFLERRFFREKHDLQQALHDLAKAIPHAIDRQGLETLLRHRVQELLHPSAFAFLEAEGEQLVLHRENITNRPLPSISRLLRRRGAALTPEMLGNELVRLARRGGEEELRLHEFSREVEVTREAGLEVLVPAFAGERLVGALALGAKRSETAYEGAELDMLQIVAGQVGVQLENTRLYDQALERQRLQEELEMARTIQRRLLPSSLPTLQGYELAALNMASDEVSGDYYDFVDVAGDQGIIISDVSGKGLPASLLASNLQASMRALAISAQQLGPMLKAVNEALYASTDPDRYATLFFCCLNEATGKLHYSNAGHNPPLLRRADGSEEWLSEGATPLGAFPGMDYPEASVDLRPGDVLVLYTDGLTETEDPEGTFFAESGLQATVAQFHGEDAETMLDGLREAVQRHSGRGKADDDLTMIVLRAHAKAQADDETDGTAGP